MAVDRVLIWGTGNVYFMNRQLLDYLKEQGYCRL